MALSLTCDNTQLFTILSQTVIGFLTINKTGYPSKYPVILVCLVGHAPTSGCPTSLVLIEYSGVLLLIS